MVVTITTMNSRTLIKMLEKDGWIERGRKTGHISVPHPKLDLGVGITHKLLKQAGLK